MGQGQLHTEAQGQEIRPIDRLLPPCRKRERGPFPGPELGITGPMAHVLNLALQVLAQGTVADRDGMPLEVCSG